MFDVTVATEAGRRVAALLPPSLFSNLVSFSCSLLDNETSTIGTRMGRMAIAYDASTTSTERDLTAYQRSLADDCFDEGQYEAAIAVLDEIRSRKYKPFP